MRKIVSIVSVFALFSGMIITNSCKKDPVVPSLTTSDATSITVTSLTTGGNISSDGGALITASGVCYGTTSGPTTSASFTTDGSSGGSFVSKLTGLAPNTMYYIRAYATNKVGTAYGNEVTATTAPPTLSILTTAPITSPTVNSAVSGGSITSGGNDSVTVRGVCWATTTGPTTSNGKTADGAGTGNFVSTITGLQSGVIYYVRAYATNTAGTAYGNEIVFSTNIADIEGNTYKTVPIGTQMWMAENLKTTKLNNNTAIPIITDNTLWKNATAPAYCWYANDGTTNKPLYGAIYNFFTVATGKLCPTGWHVPTDVEFQTLEVFLGMDPTQANSYEWRGTNQGAQLKNTTGWATGMNGTNSSGWSALPGGYRYGLTGVFNDVGHLSYWWSSTSDPVNAMYRRLDGADSTGVVMNKVYRAGVVYTGGKYIRCVK
jgi:uncharacterized protein (TIGR02145 family)